MRVSYILKRRRVVGCSFHSLYRLSCSSQSVSRSFIRRWVYFICSLIWIWDLGTHHPHFVFTPCPIPTFHCVPERREKFLTAGKHRIFMHKVFGIEFSAKLFNFSPSVNDVTEFEASLIACLGEYGDPPSPTLHSVPVVCGSPMTIRIPSTSVVRLLFALRALFSREDGLGKVWQAVQCGLMA